MKPLLEHIARQAAGHTLVVDMEGAWDAPRLLAAVDELAPALTGAAVFAVLADNSARWLAAELAAARAGAVHLPLPRFFGQNQLKHVYATSGAQAVLTDQPARIEALAAGFSRVLDWHGLTLLRREQKPVSLPTGTAKISFTSGSTGNPKGVCLSAEGLWKHAQALADTLRPLGIERHLVTLPLPLLLENVAGLHAGLLLGATLHIPPLSTLGWQGGAGFDAALLQGQASACKAQSMMLVPELAKAWALHLEANQTHAPGSLRYVAVGGAKVADSLLTRCRAKGIPLYQGYGLTECGSVTSLNRPDDQGSGVGRPLPHLDMKIEQGEICIRSTVFLGYIGDGAAALTPWYHTGDLGHLDTQGHLHLAGRRKNLLITAFGRNVSPEWVESALLSEPAIAQCVVLGDGEPCLAAVIVPMPGATATQIAQAIASANATLPDYAHIRHWHCSTTPFSAENGLATGNGRPLRAAIAERHATALRHLYSQEEIHHAVL